MNKVDRNQNWCDIDRLDDMDLEDGEKVRVLWPDGTKDVAKVIVKKSSYTTSDMGHPWEVPVSKAYIKAKVHGQSVMIALADTNIKLERAKTRSKK